MNSGFPFEIPGSLAGHYELFGTSPEKAINNLERQLKRRGYDAVGHFLLAWFYLQTGDRENAIQCAIRAKNYAPGSHFFDKLPYFLEHPDGFGAWVPPTVPENAPAKEAVVATNRIHVDLDSLIDRLSNVESTKIVVSEDTPVPANTSKKVFNDDIATETLARIYESQQRYEEAIEMYKRIARNTNGDKQPYLDAIQRLMKHVSA